ncbi:MAG: XdhC family protein [Blastocatellia bacterium]|nr:XdhC family protein [Blastocatellia bacterium]
MRGGNSVELEVIRSVLGFVEGGERVALATVVETRGSVPRKAGSKMAVAESGRIVGTVGGGCGGTGGRGGVGDAAGWGGADGVRGFDGGRYWRMGVVTESEGDLRGRECVRGTGARVIRVLRESIFCAFAPLREPLRKMAVGRKGAAKTRRAEEASRAWAC